MRKARAVSLCCCLATTPLIGCTGDLTAMRPPSAPVPVAATETPAPWVSAVRDAAPAAILVVLPGAGGFGADPELWAREGFDLVTPPAEFLQFAADREAALAQLVASARALADAPVWLVGPDPAVEAALAAPGGGVSGVVVTSAGTRTGSCTESFSYFDPGTGAPPKVTFNKSGDACAAGAISAPAFGAGTGPATTGPATTGPGVPAAKPGGPRIIDASAEPEGMSSPARQAYMRQLAELIKGAPPG